MKCQKCGIREANTHLTKIINGVKEEYFLCDKCANVQPAISYNLDVGLTNFLSGIFAGSSALAAPNVGIPNACSECGTTFMEFSQTSKLGCSACYGCFRGLLAAPLKKIHLSNEHTGKIPKRLYQSLGVEREVKSLEGELSSCISAQNFERAAEIRDKIKELKGGAEHVV